jgi:hypothetical protein
MYEGVKVKLHAFLTSTEDGGVSGLKAPVDIALVKYPGILIIKEAVCIPDRMAVTLYAHNMKLYMLWERQASEVILGLSITEGDISDNIRVFSVRS